ncbi:MAG: glycoside hydrolase family 92 protein, partial [Candidatus Krumholzibacteria bacterium]|nr:glycoside hydrolase family 92 protein [Candidatus Krumholzibacteria bacterium]
IVVKVALSSVSARGALENLRAEMPHWDFNRVRADARRRWEEDLSRISIDADGDRLVNFYTSMYHAFLSPVVWSDLSGEYRGLDREVHEADGGANYTIFSLWDTYRALHPLLTIVQPGRTNDMVRSMLAHADQSVHGILPVWSHHGEENWCMIGYHAVPAIADAWLKGIRGYDAEEALSAMIASATYAPYDGIGDCERYGYVPEDRSPNSASKTLEYAYDDWTIYRMAEALGRSEEAEIFLERAQSWRNLFDPTTGFIRARHTDGSWLTPFDPLATSGQGYIEGNAWNYSLYVPHDPAGLIELMGGRERFVARLDSLFTMETPEESYAHTEDITRAGIIGTYVHGNEPGHHIPYLYVYAGAPRKTQERVHEIAGTMYRNAADGLCGNDDCGQMSAWYVFSTLGFYPVCPGSGEYVFGSPGAREAAIRLGNGKTFAIRAEDFGGKNIYIQSITLNGAPHRKCFIRHADIMRGGELVFEMGPSPAEAWPDTKETLPYSMSGGGR